MQFHLQDAHGIDFIRERVTLKRSREGSDEIQLGRVKRQRRGSRREAEEDQDAVIKVRCIFINTTVETMSDRWPGQSEQSSGDSTPDCSWDSPLPEDEDHEVPFGYETPLSSVYSDELIDPAILPAVAAPGLDAIEFVDLTGVDDISAKYSGVKMIQSTYKHPWPYLSHLTKNSDDSAHVDILAVEADVPQGQELAPKISTEIGNQDHSVLRASLTVGEDRGRLFQGAMLVRAEEESEYNPPAAVDSDDNQWAVEKVIEKRRIGRTVKYLVKWLGYPDSENSWERKKDIHPDIVAAFETELLLAQD